MLEVYKNFTAIALLRVILMNFQMFTLETFGVFFFRSMSNKIELFFAYNTITYDQTNNLASLFGFIAETLH